MIQKIGTKSRAGVDLVAKELIRRILGMYFLTTEAATGSVL